MTCITDIVTFALMLAYLQHADSKPWMKDANCLEEDFAKYSLTFKALWSKDDFPKQYPMFRPNAQWTKMIGRSHSDRYLLWSLDKVAKDGVKEFVEKGLTSQLDKEVQGYNGVLDAFNTPNIDVGVGEGVVKLLVDPLHSKISLMSRIVPSPDWFVGVDSYDLCRDGSWAQEVTVDLEPMDAGTDKGFTFTSPNWPTLPREPISVITSQFPDHPANSFYYPELPNLPRLATVKLRRIDPLEEDGELEDSSGGSAIGAPSSVSDGTSLQQNEVEEIPPFIEKEKKNPISLFDEPGILRTVVQPIPSKVGKKKPEDVKTKKKMTKKNRKAKKNKQRKLKKLKKAKQNKKKAARIIDCKVSAWSEWSACSKSCGYGKSQRMRKALKYPRNGGARCPPFVEERLCGSMKTCGWDHFSFSSWGDEQ